MAYHNVTVCASTTIYQLALYKQKFWSAGKLDFIGLSRRLAPPSVIVFNFHAPFGLVK